jgi:histone H3/H4
MRENCLSNSAVHRLIELAGAERVGDDAVEELRKVLEDIAIYISKDAVELASHAKRRTIKLDDIKLATKRFKLHTFLGSSINEKL